jgi:hypothetical protein
MIGAASHRLISDARTFAEVTRARMGGPIHVIGGPDEARVTIYSQQCRAINLVCALHERDPRLMDKQVAVIGAGAAGMTAASALRAFGLPASRLTIYEQAASPLYTQRASYSRFLHPRLFHWPEAGWKDGITGLPVAGWRAQYAAAVREDILSHCAALAIEFCTEVRELALRGAGVRVHFRRLHGEGGYEDFDLVLVATGFPPEPKVDATIGGTYWHALDGLDDLAGEVHVVGDGDGALTEVLMMLIDRFGHGAIERLCERLPLVHMDDLHAADLEAQGNPRARTKPLRGLVESPKVSDAFASLAAAGPPRHVVIHATNPLSGVSFLLNRALVSHLTWGPAPMVEPRNGRVDPLHVRSLGPSVIWRTGVDHVKQKPLAEANQTTKGMLRDISASLAPTGTIAPFDAGLLTSLLDGLRRPAWTPSAESQMKDGIAAIRPGWTAPPPSSLRRVHGRPTAQAERLLQILVATESDLRRLGLPHADVEHLREERWVSIDVLARAGSCPHTALVVPVSPTRRHASELLRPGGVAIPDMGLRCDSRQRLWFLLPDGCGDASPTRAAVCAMVDPRGVAKWARDQARRRADRQRVDRRWLGRTVSGEVLRGLSDVAGSDVRAQLLLAALHEQQGDWEAVRRAYVRASRQPGGERLGGAEHRGGATPYTNRAFRRVVLGFAGALKRMLPQDSAVVNHAVWLMLSAAAADLVTLSSVPELMVELGTTPAFLSDTWAPRVRMVLTPPGRRMLDFAHGEPPGWAVGLADAAIGLRARPRDRTRGDRIDSRDAGIERDRVERVRELANTATRHAVAETRPEPLVTLAQLGVWPAGSALDRELRGARR